MTDIVLIDYTNWRGERSTRRVRPVNIMFEVSQWHPKLQWLMTVFDVEKKEYREFAIKDIHSWTPEP